MRLFRCQACDQVLYFENTRCERCGHALGFLPEIAQLSALETAGEVWQPLVRPDRQYLSCANAAHVACNWLVPTGSDSGFCVACRHNRMVPDLTMPDNVASWRRWQDSIHRLIYTLRRLGLPVRNRLEDPNHGLAFDVLADEATHPDASVRAALVLGLARASGLGGMAGGQMFDLAAEASPNPHTVAQIDRLQAMKTGALLRFAVEAGAIVAGATPEQTRRLVVYGKALGAAFQVADDILDAESDEETLGKKAGKDAAHKALIEGGIAALDKAAGSAGYLGLGWEEERVKLLRKIETTPFFQTVRSGLVVSLYNQPEVWPIFGYEGESYSKGGYIERGFNDIDWL